MKECGVAPVEPISGLDNTMIMRENFVNRLGGVMGEAKRRGTTEERSIAARSKTIKRLASLADKKILVIGPKSFAAYRRMIISKEARLFIEGINEAMTNGWPEIASKIQYQLRMPYSWDLPRDNWSVIDTPQTEQDRQKNKISTHLNAMHEAVLRHGVAVKVVDTGVLGNRQGELLFVDKQPVIFMALADDFLFSSTFIHELLHVTGPFIGRWSISDQPMLGIDGNMSERYIDEELVAEIGEEVIQYRIGMWQIGRAHV